MGCSASKLDDGEAIQLCRDRKNFIKQAVKQRLCFATGHTAYVDLLIRRVSIALRNYMEGSGGEHLDHAHSSQTVFFPQTDSVPNTPGHPALFEVGWREFYAGRHDG